MKRITTLAKRRATFTKTITSLVKIRATLTKRILTLIALFVMTTVGLRAQTITGEYDAPNVPDWVKNAVFYQIYPQTFCDSDGDGIGDI